MDKSTETTEQVVETSEGVFESAAFVEQQPATVEEVKDEQASESSTEPSGSEPSGETRSDGDEVADGKTEEEAPEDTDPKSDVEKRLAELEAQMQLREIYDSVGGQEAYQVLADKAKESLPAHIVEAYDDIVVNGSIEQAKFAVAALQAMVGPIHTEAEATYGGAQPTADNSFKDTLDFMSALKDPRYNVDPLYTQSVVEKLANSPHVSL